MSGGSERSASQERMDTGRDSSSPRATIDGRRGAKKKKKKRNRKRKLPEYPD